MPTSRSGNDRAGGWPGAAPAVVLALVTGLAWAFGTRPFDAPDEPSHVNAVIQVMRTGRPPIAIFSFENDPTGELVYPAFDRELARVCRSAGVDDPLRLSAYESYQPPLYYLIVAAAAGPLTDAPLSILTIGRLISVGFGALTILGIWLAVRRFAPDEPWLAIATAGTIALIPQFAFNAATAGNDALVYALFAWSFASWFRSIVDPNDDRWMIRSGVLTGLALLTKLSALALVPGLALLVLLRSYRAVGGDRWSTFARMSLGSLGAVAVVSGWWFVRNVWVLGDPLASNDAARYYRVRFVPFSPESWADVRSLLEPTWQSFWGRFGWMNRPLPGFFYGWTAVIVALSVGLTIVRCRRLWAESSLARSAWALMGLVFVLVVAVFLQINLTIGFQAQGRYLFPAALPIGLILVSGLAVRGDSSRARRVGLGVFWATLITMQVVGLLGG